MIETTLDELKGASLWLTQPIKGPRVNVDTVLLAGFTRVKRGEKICEIGSAHGAISLMLARRRDDISLTGIDIQPDLIDLARVNAERNGLENISQFHVLDVRNIRSRFEAQSFDVIVSNPPYGDPLRQRSSENFSGALARQGIACSIEDIASAGRYLLKDRGRAYFVFTAERLTEFLSRLSHARLEPKAIRPVYPGGGRPASVVLVKAMRSGAPGVKLLAPLFIEQGKNSDESDFEKYYTVEGCPCP